MLHDFFDFYNIFFSFEILFSVKSPIYKYFYEKSVKFLSFLDGSSKYWQALEISTLFLSRKPCGVKKIESFKNPFSQVEIYKKFFIEKRKILHLKSCPQIDIPF